MSSCRRCNEPIYFDDKHVSKTGKKIHIDLDTDEPTSVARMD